MALNEVVRVMKQLDVKSIMSIIIIHSHHIIENDQHLDCHHSFHRILRPILQNGRMILRILPI